MIAGFEYPTRGRIVLDGRDIATTPPNKREMAMVFQSYALFPHLTVYENIAYGLRLQGKSGAQLDAVVNEMTALTNLGGKEKRRPSELSGGQQQRVALARAIAIKPKVLLFDEPLSNLDAKLRVSLRSDIRALQRKLGITSVYVTHDQSEAMSLSDTIVVMNEGRIEQAGAPGDIYKRPSSKFVADFIGQANFADASVRAVSNGVAEIEVLGRVMRAPAAPGVQPGKAALLVRPESIVLGKDASADSVPARIKTATYYGATVEYDVDVSGVAWLVVDTDVSEPLAEGDSVNLHIKPGHAYVLAG
jgi:iron(III) transport system ATP-binding protein